MNGVAKGWVGRGNGNEQIDRCVAKKKKKKKWNLKILDNIEALAHKYPWLHQAKSLALTYIKFVPSQVPKKWQQQNLDNDIK